MLLGMWAVVPWLLVNNASQFLNFLSGFGIFIGQTCGIMIADYFIVHRRRLDVRALYDPRGRYRYFYGVNWRAFVVQFSFIAACLPGVINSTQPSIKMPKGYQHFYDANWFVNMFGGFILYAILSLLFPAKETLIPKGEMTLLDGRLPEGEVEEEVVVDVGKKE